MAKRTAWTRRPPPVFVPTHLGTVGALPRVASLKNLEYPRQCRRMMYCAAGLGVAIGIAGVADGDVVALLVGPLCMIALLAPSVYGQRWFGALHAQEYLTADASGLHYGSKYFVPWSLVERIAVRRWPVRRRVVLLAPNWKPGGNTLTRLGLLRGLPLSDYDRNWRANTELVSVLREHLPGQSDAAGVLSGPIVS